VLPKRHGLLCVNGINWLLSSMTKQREFHISGISQYGHMFKQLVKPCRTQEQAQKKRA
jgi:hypothetical protein